jgi:phospholipid transport system substrate-binding protein
MYESLPSALRKRTLGKHQQIHQNQRNQQRPHITAKAVPQDNSRPKIWIFLFLTAFIIAAAFNSAAYADNKSPETQEEAKVFIEKISSEAMEYLNDETLERAILFSNFKKMLVDNFNVSYIGKMSLGRYRKTADKIDISKYNELFPDYLVASYINALGKLKITEFTVRNVIPYGKKDIFVRTRAVTSKGKTADIDWRVRGNKTGEGFMIIDVKVEGISQVRTQRDDFSALILKSELAGLTGFMEGVILQGKNSDAADGDAADGDAADGEVETAENPETNDSQQ